MPGSRMGSASLADHPASLPAPWTWAGSAWMRLGLRWKLVGLVVLALLPVFVFETSQIYSRFHARIQADEQANLDYANMMSAGLTTYLGRVWAMEQATGQRIAALEGGSAAPMPISWFRPDLVVAIVSPITAVSWLSTAGTVLVSTNGSAVGRTLDAASLARITAGEDRVVSDAAPYGPSAILVATGIRSSSGPLVGIVVATVDVGELRGVLPTNAEPDRAVALVDAGGRVVYTEGPNPVSVGQRVPSDSIAWNALGGQVAVSPKYTGNDGTPRIGAAVPLPSIGWAASVSTPLAMVRAEAERDAAWETLVLLAIAAASIGAALAMGRRQLGSIEALQRAATAISQGDWNARVHGKGDDELAVAGRAFDRMADRIAELETDLDRFFTLSNDLFCIVDSDLLIRRMNPACSALLGLSPEALRARPWTDLVCPEDRERVAASVEALLRGERVPPAEMRLLTADGGHRWVVWNATGAGGVLYGVGHDITSRRQTEEALEASNERFHSLLAASPVPIVVTEQGLLTMWNPAAERVFGWRSGEVLGRALPVLPSGADERRDRLQADPEEAVIGAAVRCVRRDGGRMDMLASSAPLLDVHGHAYGHVTIYVDITERNRFLQIAAHELRNPMAGVKGVLGLLHRRIVAGQPMAGLLRMADVAEREVDRLGTLPNEILDAFRVQEGRLTLRRRPADLGEVVSAACRSLVAASDRIVVERPPDRPIWVLGDVLRLEEVVRNLVGNAVKYSPDGGEIRVTLAVSGERVRLSVADRGVGIPPDQLGRVFEEFFRASNLDEQDPGGLGLGLYICRDIVQRHGGRIWVESQDGRGSTFHVEMPCLAEDMAGVDAAGSSQLRA